MKPRVLLLCDARGWGIDRNAQDLARALGHRYDFAFCYAEEGQALPDADAIVSYYPRAVPPERAAHTAVIWPAGVFDPERLDPMVPDPDYINRFASFGVLNGRLYDAIRRDCPRARVFTNPVDTGRFSGGRATPENGIVACFAGRARGRFGRPDLKGVETILIPACREAGVPLRLAVPDLGSPVAPDAMPEFYAGANVTLLASLWEGAPNAVLEAMAMGHAVLSTPVGNLCEIAESERRHLGRSGIIFCDRDPRAFAEALRSLTAEQIREMGDTNRAEIAARWSWDTWHDSFREVIDLAFGSQTTGVAVAGATAASRRPRVIVLIDVWHWAWARKAMALRRCLSDEFDIDVHASADGIPAPEEGDLYHTFDFPMVALVPPGRRCVTGSTAHVLGTWGDERIRTWAERALALHANSQLLLGEIRRFHDRCYYTPNGVDPDFWRRTRRRRDDSRLVVGHVGKPNPRKGADRIAEACRRAGVEFRVLSRRAQDALPAEDVREFYQDLHVIAFSSDFDGTPNPALEAAACEVAIVGNRIGNLPELIDEGVNGHLVERTVESIAARLGRLDVSQAVKMGKRARETILRDWTWERQAERYRTLWREALA